MRLRRILVVLVAALATLVGVALPVHAATSDVSTAHPYSNPVWWPLGAGSSTDATVQPRFGCFKANPGCTSPPYHSGWLLDVRVADSDNHVGVYAMGAGIVHIGQSGLSCNGSGGRGNYLYIDHGAGVLSYYGHLSKVLFVKNGQYVSARQKLAYASNTGYSGCHSHPNLRYFSIQVRHGGTSYGTYVEITHLYACVKGVKQNWPSQLATNPNGSWSRLNDIPNLTPMPAADASRSCIVVPPVTATHPIRVAIVPYASGVRVSWAAPGPAYHVLSGLVQLQLYHPSIHAYLAERSYTSSPKSTRVSLLHLQPGHRYRFRMQFYNAAGWSAPSVWVYRTLPR